MIERRPVIKKLAACLVLVAALAIGTLFLDRGFATATPNSTVYAENGIAIRGYDPVAYFTAKTPTKGTSAHSIRWQRVTWYFASAKNRELFDEDPQKYAPQYGGYCAWAVAAKGQAYSIDPTAWSVVDDKLYLNYSHDIQNRWEKDIPGFIATGNKKWPKLKKDLALRGS